MQSETRLCSRCRTHPRDIPEFSWCRLCRKEVDAARYQANKDEWRQKRKKKKQAMRDWLRSLRLNTPCTDCGRMANSPDEMEWDHLPQYTKEFEISRGPSMNSWRRLKEELTKCELVCVACHKARTRGRFNGDFTRNWTGENLAAFTFPA